MNNSKVLNFKYSSIQIINCLGIAAMLGYATIFLLDRGFSNSSIGIIVSSSSIIATILQPLLASLKNKFRNVSLKNFISIIMVIASLLALMTCIVENNKVLAIILIFMYSIFTGISPLITSLTFEYEKNGYKINFGLARGLGSASFALSSLLLGYLIKVYSSDVIPLFYLVSTIGVLVLVYLFTIPQQEINNIEEEKDSEELTILQFISKYKRFMIFLLGVILIFIDHTIINTYTIQIIENLGGDSSSMGTALFIASILELPIMAYFMRLKEKIDCSKLIIIASIFFSIKHVITFFASNMTMIYIAQVMQVFSYAIYLPASVYYVKEIINKKDSIKGQAILGGATTLASVLASLSGGFLLDLIGISKLLLLGAIVSIIGTIIVCLNVQTIPTPPSFENPRK